MRLIDADYLKQALSSNCKPELCPDYENAWCKTCCPHNDFENIIDDVPTVKTRPQGEWEFDSEHTEFGNPYGAYKCSCCGGHSSDKYPYCFWCGADMRGKEE